MKTSSDALIIGGVELHSRLFIGTGKYGSDSLIPAVEMISTHMPPKKVNIRM